MDAKEIISILTKRSKKPELCAVRMAIVNKLYSDGYTVECISTALSMSRCAVSYAIKRVQDAKAVNDIHILRAISNTSGVNMCIIPRYEKEGHYMVLKKRLKIDNLKL